MTDMNTGEPKAVLQRYAIRVQEADASLQRLVEQMRVRLEGLHDEKLEPNDPFLMAMSANLLAVERAVESTKAAQDEVLRAHRSELELLSARWQRDADVIGQRIASLHPHGTTCFAGSWDQGWSDDRGVSMPLPRPDVTPEAPQGSTYLSEEVSALAPTDRAVGLGDRSGRRRLITGDRRLEPRAIGLALDDEVVGVVREAIDGALGKQDCHSPG